MNAKSAAGETTYDTVPKLLLRNVERHGSLAAMREKAFGIWQTWTWSEVFEEVRALSIGLQKLGLKHGDTVAIIGDNRPRLYWTFCAAQSLGAIPVPLYQDSVADEMAYVLEHAEVSLAVVENQEQVDKLLSVSDQVASLKTVVYDETRGLSKYDHTHLHSIDDVQKAGRDQIAQNPEVADTWRQGILAGKGSDVAVMPYTSGTTGRPKGVVLTQSNIVISAQNGNTFDNLGPGDELLAYLPMAWIGDHIFSYGQSYAGPLCVACPENADTAIIDRREIGPTYFFAPPRVFENMLTQLQVRMEDAGGLKQRMVNYFLKVAERTGADKLDGKPVSFGNRLLYQLGEWMVYGPLKNQMGLTKTRVAYTAGEAIGPELFSFYRSIGINLKQLYGQTEASVYVTGQRDGDVFSDSVGVPMPDVELEIADNGEVLYRSPGVFLKYYKNDEETQKTKTPDGWVKTGDAGFIDQRGHLHIIDRAKDVGKLSDGTMFAPKYIENRLKFFPEIQEAVALGDGREFCTVFINIDLTSVANWAERNNIIYGSYQELAAHPDVYEMIEKRVDTLNAALAKEPKMAGAQIRRFLILHKELDADDGELTRTQKVRRSFIAERYAPLIEALYSGANDCHIETEVTFEDGSTGKIEGDVKIRDMAVHKPSDALMEAAE